MGKVECEHCEVPCKLANLLKNQAEHGGLETMEGLQKFKVETLADYPNCGDKRKRNEAIRLVDKKIRNLPVRKGPPRVGDQDVPSDPKEREAFYRKLVGNDE